MTRQNILDEALNWDNAMTSICCNIDENFYIAYMGKMQAVSDSIEEHGKKTIGQNEIASIIEGLLAYYINEENSDQPNFKYYSTVAAIHSITDIYISL